MTRETKIGLLVGLGFIIVIGILLSDHIQSSTEPPAAVLSNAGTTVRSTVNAPNATPNAAVLVTAPENVAPAQPVATNDSMANAPVPTQVIKIGPASPETPTEIKVTSLVAGKSPAAAAVPLVAEGPAVVMVPGTPAGPAVSIPETVPVVKPEPAAQKGRIYVAAAGDSLSKMATRLYGANTKANRDLIISANKELKANPARIIAGHSYVIPYNPGEKTPVAAADNATSKIEPAPAPSAAANAAKPSGGEIVYTVKAGDNLWKIAREHLGSGTPATIAQIKELNRDVLKGGDALKLNMKLKLPAKVVASAD